MKLNLSTINSNLLLRRQNQGVLLLNFQDLDVAIHAAIHSWKTQDRGAHARHFFSQTQDKRQKAQEGVASFLLCKRDKDSAA